MLGLPVELVLPIEHDRVTIAFLAVGESKVELVQPTDDTTGVARFLANKGEGFHHVCFEVAGYPREADAGSKYDGSSSLRSTVRRRRGGPGCSRWACHGRGSS